MNQLKTFVLVLLLFIVSHNQAIAAGVCTATELEDWDEVRVPDMKNEADILGFDDSKVFAGASSTETEDLTAAVQKNISSVTLDEDALLSSESQELITPFIESEPGVGEALMFGTLIQWAVGISKTFKNPQSTDLDKATAVTGIIPGIGIPLMLADTIVHNNELKAEIRKRNQESERLEAIKHLTVYKDSVSSQETVHKFIDKLTKGEHKTRLKLSSLVNSNLYRITDFNEVELEKYIDHAVVPFRALTAKKLSDESAILQEARLRVNRFLKPGSTTYPAKKQWLVDYNSNNKYHYPGYCSAGLDSYLNDNVANIKNARKDYLANCLLPILVEYFDNIANIDHSGSASDQQTIKKYINVANYARGKFQIKQLNKLSSDIKKFNGNFCPQIKTRTDQIFTELESYLANLAETGFWKNTNLDTQGRSLNPVCWNTKKTNCKSATSQCYDDWFPPGISHFFCSVGLPLTFYPLWVPEVCDEEKVYICEPVTYDKEKDPDYKKGLAALTTTKANIKKYACSDSKEDLTKYFTKIAKMDTQFSSDEIAQEKEKIAALSMSGITDLLRNGLNRQWKYENNLGIYWSYSKDGNVQCASNDGTNCIRNRANNPAYIDAYSTAPLVCGNKHAEKWGGDDGYSNRSSWCDTLASKYGNKYGIFWKSQKLNNNTNIYWSLTKDGEVTYAFKDMPSQLQYDIPFKEVFTVDHSRFSKVINRGPKRTYDRKVKLVKCDSILYSSPSSPCDQLLHHRKPKDIAKIQ